MALLAGSGLGPGGPSPARAATLASFASAGTVTLASFASAGVDAHLPAPGLAAGVDEREAGRATAAIRAGAGARAHLPAPGRLLAVACAGRPGRARPGPAVDLATIGVCRT